jgi:hypothetical protein
MGWEYLEEYQVAIPNVLDVMRHGALDITQSSYIALMHSQCQNEANEGSCDMAEFRSLLWTLENV